MTEQIGSEDVLALLTTAIQGRSGTAWIGVDGLGASGKTTLATRICAALGGSVVIHIDDFARPDLRGWERARFIEQVLEPLQSGRTARYQRWDWSTNSGAEWIEVAPGGPIIVEGVSATDVRLGVPWDFTIWVETPPEVRLRRALERDGEQLLQTWLNEWIPSEDDYEREQRPQGRVDAIVDGGIS